MSFVVTQNRNLEAHFTFIDGMGEKETTLSVFPNPTSGKVTIKGLQEKCLVRLMDEHGHPILAEYFEGEDVVLDLGTVSDGYYIVSVLFGAQRRDGKIVKISR